MARRKRNKPSVRIETQGDVNLSMDDVGRDKVTVAAPDSEKGKKQKSSIVQWIGTIPALVKLAEFVGLSVK